MTIDSTRLLAATLVCVAYFLLCAAVIHGQWRKRRQAAHDAAALTPAAEGTVPWLVAFASQTGFAEQLAWRTARLLHTAGVSARVASLATLEPEDLIKTERALFLASTYGEGDQPDNATLFARKLMSSRVPLHRLRYGVLALGDREYANFCGFGRRLDQWLQTQGAQALFVRVEMDNGNQEALQQWQRQLSHIAGTRDLPDWQAPTYEGWRLAARTHLNPGSAGNPCFHIELQPRSGNLPQWQAGDLVQISAPADPRRPREYSIASLPTDGRVHLLVRQERHADGSLGAASGWLTAHAAVGATVELRLRTHADFHLGENATRPLIFIGNGTGLAGLRSHLKARAAAHEHRNWLIFGERNAAHDFYHRDEIETWRAQGVLTRVDLAFSRDQPEKIYVQDCLRRSAAAVREWLGADAAVYVCGSLEGMASGVEAALLEILGEQAIERLIETGRYRRDVY